MRPNEALEALRETNPARYQQIVAEQQKYAFVPHSAGQRAILVAQQRFIVVRAGRRYGKTKVAARRLISHAMRHPGTVDWWVANTYKNTRRGYREVVRQLPPQFLAKPAPPATSNDLIIELKNGSRLEFYSSTNPDSMAGEGVGYVVVDEAALQGEAGWYQIIRPTLMDSMGGALLISTPRGRNWFYEMDRRGRDPKEADYASFHFTTSDNPYIAPSEVEEMKKDLPELLYRQEVLAEFIAGNGGIFMVPEDSLFEGPVGFQKGEQIVMGVDLAKHEDFTVLTAARMSDRLPVYHDRFTAVRWGEQKELIVDAVEYLKGQGAAEVTLAVDSTGVGDVVFDDLEDLGLDVVGIKFSDDWKRKAVRQLAADLERRQAFLTVEQIKEFEDYEYEITPKGNILYHGPEGGHDDEVAAKLLEHWVLTHESHSEADVSSFETSEPVEESQTVEEIVPRDTQDLINDPAVWTRAS